MARAWVMKDRRGGLMVRARARIDGKDVTRDKTIPNADQSLADETARELSRRFMLGDFSWLTDRKRARTKTRKTKYTFSKFADQWIDDLEGQIEESTRRSYRSAVNAWKTALSDVAMDRVTTSSLMMVRRDWVAANLKDRTIGDRMSILRLIYREARIAGLVDGTPFDTPMSRRTTKRARRERSSRRVTFQPFSSDELTKLLVAARNPKTDAERRYWPLAEYLLLTGQRFGEGAALRFDDINRTSNSITIQRARPPVGPASPDDPTKTGAEWRIAMSPALVQLLAHQRETHFLRGHGWVFPTDSGTAQLYANWKKRGWDRLLIRAKVDPRASDAQKALRRTYVCSSLVCGRNPKLVAGELGHATARMVTDQYDAFLDPAHWPSPVERAALTSIYGWTDVDFPAKGAVREAS